MVSPTNKDSFYRICKIFNYSAKRYKLLKYPKEFPAPLAAQLSVLSNHRMDNYNPAKGVVHVHDMSLMHFITMSRNFPPVSK